MSVTLNYATGMSHPELPVPKCMSLYKA